MRAGSIKARIPTVAALAICMGSCGPAPVARTPHQTNSARPPSSPAMLSEEDARADLRQLRAILEESHPDAYQRAGGVVAFRRRFELAEAAIPPSGIEPQEFRRLVRPLLAQVRDGHTQLRERDSDIGTRVWVDLGLIEERVVVQAVYAPDQQKVLGATVTSIQGVPVAMLAERMATRRGYENVYTNLWHLTDALRSSAGLVDLLERAPLGDSVHLDLRLADGTAASVDVRISRQSPGARIEPPSRVVLPPRDSAAMASGFLDDAHRIGYFRLDSAMRYREAFEVWQATGYAREKRELESIPSVTQTLQTLFAEMKAKKTALFVVDLRENEGGNSLFAAILEYFLYPIDTILALDRGYQVPRYSALYFANHTSDTLEKVRARTSPTFQIGDFDFTEERAWQRFHGAPSGEELARRRREYAGEVAKSPTFAKVHGEGTWNGTWSPRVVVLTSARTYSAGFDAVLVLRAHGATVLGVPSAQAANCFIDNLTFELEHSHLRGGLSFKWSMGLPDDPKRGEMLRPDQELTYATYAAHGFDPNTSVLLAMDRAK
ncbi:S41 family peptidase [Pendulispora rubella]|uniref:S41 family peptidase n=1 Tax=Pendulispora rubella TaxID=2741070 RepID=A0ABZ2KTJ9_9BACT